MDTPNNIHGFIDDAKNKITSALVHNLDKNGSFPLVLLYGL